MKKVLCLLAIIMVVACSKDDEYESVFEAASEENINIFKAISEDINTYLELNASTTYEEIQNYLEKYSSQISTCIEDSFLYVTTPGGLEIQIDGYGLSVIDDSDYKFDEDLFLSQVSTIDKSLGIEDNNSTRAIISSEKYDHFPITRSVRNDERVLSSRRIMLWAPWTELDIYEFQRIVHAIASAFHLDFNQERDEYIGNECTFESMKLFNGYDIVVLVCHGNSRGQLIVPYTSQWKTRIGKGGRIGDIYVKNDTKYEKEIVLDKDMASCLPKDMSKTILWTGMCYSFCENSAIKGAVLKSNAADFVGATGKVDRNVVIPYLSQFAMRFYRGATTAEAFYPQTPRKTYYSYKTRSGEKGLYCKGDIDNVYYQYPICLPVKGSVLRGCRTTPYNRMKTRGTTRASLNDDAGFWIKNTETGKEITIPFSESSKVSYKTYNFENIITSYIFECNTDDFEKGTYEYRTYELIDGQYVYSEEMYSFTNLGFPITFSMELSGEYKALGEEVAGVPYFSGEKRATIALNRLDDGRYVIFRNYPNGYWVSDQTDTLNVGQNIKTKNMEYSPITYIRTLEIRSNQIFFTESANYSWSNRNGQKNETYEANLLIDNFPHNPTAQLDIKYEDYHKQVRWDNSYRIYHDIMNCKGYSTGFQWTYK
ncbi:MAG: hypothetical protein IJ537_04000 [Bacteroidaceae bacterium]|nr:hypothetical protein [Bacteroidaceae bacterium]